MTRRRVEQAGLAAFVLALHALLLWAWPERKALPRGSMPSVAVVTLPISIVRPPPREAPTATSPAVPTSVEARPRARTTAVSERPAAVLLPPEVTTAPAPPPAAAEATASQPLDLRLRLSPEMARRGGLTEPAGSMRAQALNDPRSNDAPDPQQRLPDAVAASAKGDCLKGEYAGAGLGLLSVPFLAYHAAVGNCKPSR
jgi:hypothetical protein